jgi:hypothetical protein
MCAARRRRFEREDRQSVALPALAGRARDDQQQRRGIAVQHQRLAAVQQVAVAAPLGARLHVGRVVARIGLGHRERDLQLAAAQLRQPFAALRRRTGLLDQLSGEHDAREPGSAAECAPKLLRNEHQLDRAEAAAAELGIERQPEQAEFGHAGPAPRGDVGAFRVAAPVRRVLAVAEAPHRVAQRDMIFVQ